VSNRIGIAKSEDPEVVEQQLCAAMPPAEWTRTSDTLILHGRRICRPHPLCDRCAVRDDCDYYRNVIVAVVKRGTRKPQKVAKKRGSAQNRSRRLRTEQKVADEPSSGGSRERTGRGGGAPRQSKKR